jgi:hypothetical protein
MKIYKVYKSEDILKKSEKHILHKEKAVKYFNDLISEEEKAIATVKLSEKEWQYEVKEIKLLYGDNSIYLIDNKRNIVICEYIQAITNVSMTVAIMMYKYIDEEDDYESVCSELFYIEEIDVEE